MRDFFDTSVLVASFHGGHVHHPASIRLLSAATPKQSCCGLHTLAEVYATMTALPVRPPIPPEQALLFVEEVRNRLAVVSLSEDEYVEAIRAASDHGFSSGRVYDSLLLRCAAKSKAQNIYTWNIKHFQALAPQLASRIRTP